MRLVVRQTSFTVLLTAAAHVLCRAAIAQPGDAELLPPPPANEEAAADEAINAKPAPTGGGAFPAPLIEPDSPLAAPPESTGDWPTENAALDGRFDGHFEDDSLGHDPLKGGGWIIDWFGARHSLTHGRAIGPGGPLRGTSWLNRPYEITAEFGALIMTSDPANNVRSANDLFAALQMGWDWDHYWGGQVRIGWSTPSFDNESINGEQTTDNFFLTDASVLYYPWGDSRVRPYCRLGMGLTDIEFTNASARRQQEQLFTIPLAIGIKRMAGRNTAFRAEFANNLAFSSNEAKTQNNITFTLGFEGRFGGKSSSYWAWNPRGRAW